MQHAFFAALQRFVSKLQWLHILLDERTQQTSRFRQQSGECRLLFHSETFATSISCIICALGFIGVAGATEKLNSAIQRGRLW